MRRLDTLRRGCVLYSRMTTKRFALCALLVSSSAGHTLAADNHGMLYASLNYDVAFPASREVALFDDDEEPLVVDIDVGVGFLGVQIGVGYAIRGFRPEVYFAYRSAPITGLTSADRSTDILIGSINWDDKNSTVSSLDLGLGVHYDIDTGTPLLPYLGAAGGVSNITVNNLVIRRRRLFGVFFPVASFDDSDSAWAFGFQGNAGIGLPVAENLVVTLGYRLTGTTEADLATSETKLKLALIHNGELGLRLLF